MQNNQSRTLSPYEKNHLQKYGVPQSVALATQSPVEYLTSHVDFCGLEFFVDQSVLIPRIETEELVDMAVKELEKIYFKVHRELKIIDIGTGSGAIAICVSKRLIQLNIPFTFLATEITSEALNTAKKNAKKLLPQAPITFKKTDLLDGITQKFDLIISNLPYIPAPRIGYLSKSVKDYEPHIALDGGENGLTLIHKMIRQAQKLVYPHTKILLEVDYTHGYDDFNQFRENWDILVTPDSSEGVHFVMLQRK